jgi:hypothetical protein
MTRTEGLKAARLMMVLSSMSPLFILWLIRGNDLVPDIYFVTGCAILATIPSAVLWLRIHIATKQGDKRELVVGSAEDHRDHLLVYLFAMLLPLYSENSDTWRELGALTAALAFIVFLFWHLNMHYMNLLFAAMNLRVHTVYPPIVGGNIGGQTPYAVITHRAVLSSGDRLVVYRISNTVYLEART